jgi:hypothetical protein
VDIGRTDASSLPNPEFYSFVAEDNGDQGDNVIGNNFLDEHSNIVAGVELIT